MTTVVACIFFGAISGSGIATVAAIGMITIPAMVERGYSRTFSAAIIACAGAIGVMIPPSNPFVLYGVITNTNSISIEMCDTIRNGVYQASEATLANAAALGRELMEKYHIPIENVYRHFDVTGKHCPSYLVNAQKWAEFKKRLEVKIVDNTPSGAHKEGVEWAVENGILRGNAEGDLMLSQSVTREQLCTMLYRFARLLREA